ncbi:alpha/beta hydrolase [Streptomyces sp. BPTC-684]|uniref:alpha/beta fold hydrolase n=1 Tax=Streptomyces sp. BPTC-684 TaxID=3043734 RepID=UPI0024B0AEAC|nr:alpha/beta hydrolase [Streptomyces sp. BPTC-684]WHM40295.1 alpha/beta hydrolase [Streptomyces sp. BPTC-684]
MSGAWASWERRESGVAGARGSALLLPGGMCRAGQYEELMAEPALAGVRLVAVTLPGHGGTPAPRDTTVENYARLAAECAAELGCDVVVGHSMGANVALEMAGSGAFRGPVVLLAPSFSRQDEAVFLRALDRLTDVLGHLPYSAMLKLVGGMAKQSPLPPDRVASLIADLRRNDPRAVRRAVRDYLRYLDRHGTVAPRLCEAGVPAWVVHGESGDGGATDAERCTLEACPQVSVVTIPGPSFFTPNEEPALVAELVVEALARTR